MDRLFRVNVLGVYLCARAAVPIMDTPEMKPLVEPDLKK